MPRYFFDFSDGNTTRDPVGHECTDCHDINLDVMKSLAEIVKAKIPKNGKEQSYTVLVRNENNMTVYTATVTYSGKWLGEDIPPTEESVE